MSKTTLTLKAELRSNTGTSAAVKVREKNGLPAVIYGPELKENLYISFSANEFEKVFQSVGTHKPFTVEVGKNKYQVIIKGIEIHPVSRKILHVDLYAFAEKKPFVTEVPVKFVGTPIGVKEGGSMFVYARKLKISTTIDRLPEVIEVDVSHLKAKDYLIVRDVKVDGVKIMTHEGTTLVEVR